MARANRAKCLSKTDRRPQPSVCAVNTTHGTVMVSSHPHPHFTKYWLSALSEREKYVLGIAIKSAMIDITNIAPQYMATFSLVSKSSDFLQTCKNIVTRIRPMELGAAVGRVPPLSSWLEFGRKFMRLDLRLLVAEPNVAELPAVVYTPLRFPVAIV